MKAKVNSRTVDMQGILVSPAVRSMVFQEAEKVQAKYRGLVAKRTGELARSVRVATSIGVGVKPGSSPRWRGHVIASAPHAAAHEFGGKGRRGYHELRQALR